jgi:putative ABC transport system permease protein
LLGELALTTLAAVPVGLVLGYALVVFTSLGYDSELFRLPVIIYRSTYGLAVAVVLLAASASALIVRRQLDQLDLVAVLKARD